MHVNTTHFAAQQPQVKSLAVKSHVENARREVQTVADWGARTAIKELASAVEQLNIKA